MEILLRRLLSVLSQFVYRNVSRIFFLRRLLILNSFFLMVNVFFLARNSLFEIFWLPVESHFLSPLDPEEKDLLVRTFRVFVEALYSNNVTFFIFSGTLVGSFRHHDIIPWDDDIDVIVNASDRDRVSRVLSTIDPTVFGLYNSAWSGKDYFYQWKFYPKRGRSLLHKNFRTPNIDLFFFLENATHIWNASPTYAGSEIWPKSHVFPVRRRPFGGLLVPAPCNAEGFLGRNFNITECRSRTFSHIVDFPLPYRSVVVPCSRLARLYPFVERQNLSRNGSSHSVQETLRLGKWTLGRFIAETPC